MNIFATFYQEFQFVIESKYNRLLNNTTTDFKEIVISLNNIVRRILTAIKRNFKGPLKIEGRLQHVVVGLFQL